MQWSHYYETDNCWNTLEFGLSRFLMAFSSFFFIFSFLQCLFTFAELVHGKNDFEVNIAIFTENVLLLMTLTKITKCWINRRSLRRLLVEIQNNFIVDKYNTYEKKFILMKYTNFAKYYFLITVPSMTIAAIFYYIQELMPNVKMGNHSITIMQEIILSITVLPIYVFIQIYYKIMNLVKYLLC